MNHRRSTSSVRKSRPQRRPSKSQQRWTRRALLAEHLESRQLLAGDLSFHNAFFPQDVDQNNFVSARDALVIINQLNAGGPRQFLGGSTSSATTSSSAEGEGDAATPLFMYDVNNDGYVSASDAMRVVNLLNEQAGEHAEVMEFRIVYLQPGTNNPIPGNTITKGTDFEIGVIVQDIRGPDTLNVFGDRGVAAASIDLLLNTKALANVELEEVQTLRITGNPTGGTFTLSFNDGAITRTTAGIQYNPLTESRVAIANRIQTALAALSNVGAGNVEVVPADAIFGGVPTDFAIRFQGALGNKSLQLMTGNPSGLTGGTNPQLQITELFDGSFSTESFRRSLLRRYQIVAGQLIDDYNTVVTGADASNPDRIDNAGGLHSDFLSVGHFPDGQEADPRLLLRFRMDTLDAGNFTVVGSVADVDENLLYSVNDAEHGDPLSPSEIKITNPPVLTIIEPFSANPDNFNFNEDLVGGTSPATLTVLANDTNNNATTGAPTGSLPTNVIITALNGVAVNAGQSIITSSGGTVVLNTGSKTLDYTPAPNFNGQDTFTYTIRNPSTGVTDTATVTINLAPVNDPPVNTLPAGAAARTVAEDGTLFFPGNISVADVDAGGNDIQTTVSVAHGTLTLGTTTGLTFIAGDGTDDETLTFQGTVAEINAALNGMAYQPDSNKNGEDTLQMITSDLGNTPAPAQSDTDSITLIVTAVNDAPTINIPGDQSAIETIETTLDAITVNDVDFTATDAIAVTLSVDGLGTFSLASLTGLNFTAGDGTADSTMSFNGTLANVNAALAGIKYTAGLGDAAAPRTLSINANDGGIAGAGGAKSASASVTVNVIPLDRPFARDDEYTVDEDSLATDPPNPLNVLANDFKDDGNSLVIVDFTQGSNGTVIDNGNGTLSYVPNADFFGTDTFTYTINQTIDPKPPEELDEDQVATVTITVTNTPDAPVANDDLGVETNEDTLVDIAVLANDRDIDLSVNPANQTPTGATHTVTVISGPAHGTTQVINGVVRYTPAQDYHGTDGFVYQIDDGVFTDTANVEITVLPVNDAPVANPEPASVDEDSFVDIAVLANDRDVDLSMIPSEQVPTTATHTVIVVGNPAHGTAVVNGDGTIRYTPTGDYFGPDSFTYKINDGLVDSNTATVSISVNNTPDVPVANDDNNKLTFEDTPLPINVLANDRDVDLGVTPATQVPTVATHTVTIEVQAANGSAAVNPLTGIVTYTPNPNFTGDDSFVYRLTDAGGLFDTAVVNIHVDDVNDAPEAFNDIANTDEDTAIFIPVLINDRDVDLGDTPPEQIPTSASHTITITTPPSHGTAAVQLDGTVLYTPADDYHGPDLFRYRINDGFLNSNIADVNITVVSVNDPPVVADDTFTAIKHNPPAQDFQNQQIFVLANDQVNDPDPGEVLTIVAVSDPANGTAVIAADGKSVLYTPNVGYEGPDSFTYTVEDNGLNPNNLQSTATVEVDVVNFIPTDISGTVWLDTDNDGLMEDHERRLAGVQIRLQGTSFRNENVDITATTDINGFYIFLDVEPGDYTVTETQPFYLRDGQDVYNTTTNGFETTTPIVTGSFNDQFTISIPLLSTDNPSKTLDGNNFGEMGLDSAYINIAELLASTTNNGFLLAIGPGGESLWHQKMEGWNGALSCSVVLNSTNSLTFSVFDGVTTHTTTLTQSGTTRFRIVGQDGSGGYLIRIEGSAEDFGWTLAASQPQAEGEADYIRDVDAVMSSIGSV